jgi:plastocyanin
VTPSSTATLVNGCNPAMVTTASAGVTVQGPVGTTVVNYSPACVSVHVGAIVTFTGDFTTYSLSPGPVIDPTIPNPITFTNMGTSAQFTFPNAGSFGFYSMSNPTTMLGAVFVVP